MRSGVWAVMREGLFSERGKVTDVWIRENHTKVLDQSDVVLDLDQSLGLDAPGRADDDSSAAMAADPTTSSAHDLIDAGELTSGRSGRTHPGPCPDQNRPDRNRPRASGVSRIRGGDR